MCIIFFALGVMLPHTRWHVQKHLPGFYYSMLYDYVAATGVQVEYRHTLSFTDFFYYCRVIAVLVYKVSFLVKLAPHHRCDQQGVCTLTPDLGDVTLEVLAVIGARRGITAGIRLFRVIMT